MTTFHALRFSRSKVIAVWVAASACLITLANATASAKESATTPNATYDTAMEALANEDFATAADLFRKNAGKGHRASQFRYAVCLSTGRGVEKNDAEALNWCRKAAIRGEMDAQRMLGSWYQNGREVEEDVKQAIYWYEIAAHQGDREASVFLGEIFLHGGGGAGNVGKGLDLLRKAAEEDFALAHFYLAEAYQSGNGVEANGETALAHLIGSAELDNSEAQFRLSSVYASGNGVDQDTAIAGTWMRRAADQNHPGAEFLVALWTHDGTIYERNDEQTLEWLQRSARHGSPQAARILEILAMPGESLDTAMMRLIGAATANEQQSAYLRKTASEARDGAAKISEGNRQPRPLKIVSPIYPNIEGQGELHGRVVVLIKIDEQGSVVDATVTESFHEAFNQPAIDAVSQWRFLPALKDGALVTARLKLPIKF